jgi:flagellar protein FliO/FliZ
MDLFRPDQILILLCFLGALGAVWVYVHRNRGALSDRMARGRRLRVAEAAPIGPGDRAMILSVDGRDYLLIRLKGAAPVLQALPAPVPEDAA